MDNASYVNYEESFIDQISVISSVPVQLLAVDGHTTTECLHILRKGGLKANTGGVLSVGGNQINGITSIPSQS